jgi:hypothetical protein
MQEDEVKMQSTEVFRARSSLRLPNEISDHDQHQDEMQDLAVARWQRQFPILLGDQHNEITEHKTMKVTNGRLVRNRRSVP